MAFPLNITKLELIGLVAATWLVYKVTATLRRHLKTTRLPSPPSPSWLFGVSKDVFTGDSGAIFEEWMDQYGAVYQVPEPMGSNRIILCDPKAVAYFYSKETTVYVRSSFSKAFLARLLGKGLLYHDGETHRRQRKALAPAFSNASIRDLVSVFFDSGYKAKAAWDSIIDSAGGDEAIIGVQKWMNRVSLDSIGIAGFSHDFGALSGKHSEIAATFDSFGSQRPHSALSSIVPLLGPILPILIRLPTSRRKVVARLNARMGEVANVLLDQSRSQKDEFHQSIIGALIRAENSTSELTMTEDEVIAQMKLLLFAGYETTSISLTWALVELAQHPEQQDKLRSELAQFRTRDPTYDEITNGLPYLNAVVRETLRLHPPLTQTIRMAAQDDVIPLSTPVTTPSGQTVDRITVARGTSVTVPVRCINRAVAIWGPDAKEFIPERWLVDEQGIPAKARELQGYHHLLTFVDGPRTCLGRAFAVAEFKSVLSVLVRNFVFAMRDGPETELDKTVAILPRPKLKGDEDYALPMRVRRVTEL